MTQVDVKRVVASELSYVLNRMGLLGGLSLTQYQFLAGRQDSYDQAAANPITAAERGWLQPHLGPVIVKAIGFADQPDGFIDTTQWALAELYPSRAFALEFLAVRHERQRDRASYYLWQQIGRAHV